jgi:hypothetical protein
MPAVPTALAASHLASGIQGSNNTTEPARQISGWWSDWPTIRAPVIAVCEVCTESVVLRPVSRRVEVEVYGSGSYGKGATRGVCNISNKLLNPLGMVICPHCRHRLPLAGPLPHGGTLMCEGCSKPFYIVAPEPLRVIARSPRRYPRPRRKRAAAA